MNQFIVFDTLVTDYVSHVYGISGTDFKSAICAHDLIESAEVADLMKKIAEGLNKDKKSIEKVQ